MEQPERGPHACIDGLTGLETTHPQVPMFYYTCDEEIADLISIMNYCGIHTVNSCQDAMLAQGNVRRVWVEILAEDLLRFLAMLERPGEASDLESLSHRTATEKLPADWGPFRNNRAWHYEANVQRVNGQLVPLTIHIRFPYTDLPAAVERLRAAAMELDGGLIITEQGRGTFVRPKTHVQLLVTGANFRRHRAAGLPGFNAQALEQGQRPRQVIREVGRIGAPADVAMRLQVNEGSPVIVRRRVFLLEGLPAALTDSYYPADLAGGTAIEQPDRIKGGVYALIEDPDGPIRRQVASSVDDITGRMPTPDEARELALPPGVPVFRVLRTVYDTDGRPLEVQDSVAAADRHQFRYEVEMR